MIVNIYSREKNMSIICLHVDLHRMEESRNRKQFASFGTDTGNIEIDYGIFFLLRLDLII